MKKTFRYLLLLGALTGFASCLDEVPYGTYSNETFYNTEADAESALMYAYVPINYIDYCGRFLFFLSDVPTNQYKSYGKADESPLFQWDITPTSDEAIYFFKSAYVSLARTNSVLENVSRMTSISAMARNRILGEAHFLRAFNHFMLVINYGSVPIRSKTVSTVSDSYKDFAPDREDLRVHHRRAGGGHRSAAREQGAGPGRQGRRAGAAGAGLPLPRLLEGFGRSGLRLGRRCRRHVCVGGAVCLRRTRRADRLSSRPPIWAMFTTSITRPTAWSISS